MVKYITKVLSCINNQFSTYLLINIDYMYVLITFMPHNNHKSIYIDK